MQTKTTQSKKHKQKQTTTKQTEKQKQSLENDLIDCKENLRHMRNYNDELKTKIAALEAKK
jgi:hypothetical protein